MNRLQTPGGASAKIRATDFSDDLPLLADISLPGMAPCQWPHLPRRPA
jgi:hypothetical protein